MTGCFTDNQPDFSYIAPFESRSFPQYFMPYHDSGLAHDLLISVTVKDIETFTKYLDVLPFYQNVRREVVRVA